MKKYVLLVALLLASTTLFAQVQVTFNCNLSVQIAEGNFDTATGVLVARGDFQSDAGDPNGNWQGNMFQLTDADGDSVYSITVDLPSDSVGKTYQFKFVMNEAWESVDNRTFTLTSAPTDLPVYYYNDDNVVNVMVTNTVNFQADLTGIAGTGDGYFDPGTD